MNKARLYNLIDGTEPLQNDKDLPLLKSVIEAFPYYPTSYLLLSKLLYEQDSIYFDKYLKLAAAYVGNRELLYNYLHQNSTHDLQQASAEEPLILEEKKQESDIEEVKQQTLSDPYIIVPTPTESKQEELPTAPKPPIIEHVMMTVDEEAMDADMPEVQAQAEVASALAQEQPKEDVKPAEPVPRTNPHIREEVKRSKKDELVYLPASSYDYFAVFPVNKNEEKGEVDKYETEIKTPAVGYELKQEDFDANKPHSFSDWLTYVSSKPKSAIQKEVRESDTQSKNRTEEIINTFLTAEGKPKPKAAKFFSPQEMAMKSVEEDNGLITETLANIYLRQQLYDKAIEIFQQLSLRYPQKSDYFAAKIKEIKSRNQ